MSATSSTERLALDNKIKGWAWVSAELARVVADLRAEADRLLGPDRGE